MKASETSPRLFKNDWLDFFTRSPWWLVPLFWLPICSWLLLQGVKEHSFSIEKNIILWFSGLLQWTLAEYLLHRFVFHWQPNHSWGKRFHFYIHGIHHEFPQDKYRVVMPPLAACMIALPLAGIFYIIWGGNFYQVFSGFLVGYVAYDLMHFAAHHLKAKWSLFRIFKRYHLQHHFSPLHAERKFGVSSSFWDRLFKTF